MFYNIFYSYYSNNLQIMEKIRPGKYCITILIRPVVIIIGLKYIISLEQSIFKFSIRKLIK